MKTSGKRHVFRFYMKKHDFGLLKTEESSLIYSDSHVAEMLQYVTQTI